MLAATAFVAWLLSLVALLLLLALLFGGAAYAFFLVDWRRNRADLEGYARDHDRVLDGSEPTVTPAVSAGGIHLAFMTRSRWRGKR